MTRIGVVIAVASRPYKRRPAHNRRPAIPRRHWRPSVRLLGVRIAARRRFARLARIFVCGVGLGGGEALGFNSQGVQLIGFAPRNPAPLSLYDKSRGLVITGAIAILSRDAGSGSATQDKMIPMKLEFHGYAISRTVIACAGMGATVAMLVGGTTFGVPTAIVAAIIGAIGGGVLGRFIEWTD